MIDLLKKDLDNIVLTKDRITIYKYNEMLRKERDKNHVIDFETIDKLEDSFRTDVSNFLKKLNDYLYGGK